MYKLLLIFCFTGLIISCGHQNDLENKAFNTDSDFFEINFTFNKTNKSIYSKNVIDTVIYMSLETNERSEFVGITQLEVTEKYYLILDKEANGIFFFNKNGRYIKKIAPFNEDVPIPFQRVLNFTLDSSSNILSFSDAHSENIYTFDMEGNFMSIRKKNDADYFMDNFYLFRGYKLSLDLYNQKNGDNGGSYPSISIRKDNKNILQGLEYNPNIISYNDVINNQKYFFRSGLPYLLFNRPYDYTIYKFDATGTFTEYTQIVFPNELSLPIDFLENSSYKGKRRKYISSNPKLKFSLSDIYEEGDRITFRTFSHTNTQFFIFDKSSNSIFDPSKLISDISTFYMPVFGHKIHGVDHRFFISSLPAMYMVKNIANHIGDETFIKNMPPSLKNIFNAGNNQNEILVLTKFKDQ